MEVLEVSFESLSEFGNSGEVTLGENGSMWGGVCGRMRSCHLVAPQPLTLGN